MKRTLSSLLLTVAFLASVGATSQLAAQQAVQPAQSQQKPQIPVVVVDYAYLMTVHPELHAKSQALESQYKQELQKIQTAANNLREKEKELIGLQPGMADYTQKKEQLSRDQYELALQGKKMEENFQVQELYAHYAAYMEIKKDIEAFAKLNNIVVVLNHLDVARRLPKEQSLQSIDLHMKLSDSSQIAWCSATYDITAHIETELNKRYVATNKYPKVEFEKLKEQMFNTLPGGAAPQGTTNVAAPGQPITRN